MKTLGSFNRCYLLLAASWLGNVAIGMLHAAQHESTYFKQPKYTESHVSLQLLARHNHMQLF